MTMIMSAAAMLLPIDPLVRKNKGTPTSAPKPKQMICRFVRLKRNLDLTLVRSLGTGTYAIVRHSFFINLKTPEIASDVLTWRCIYLRLTM